MWLPSFARGLTRSQRAAIVATALVLVATGVLVVTRPGDDDVDLRAGMEESTSTTEDPTMSSSDEEATTTTAGTTTSAESPTTAPPAPPESGSLDMSAVLTFAKAGVGSADPPQTSTGAYTCPAFLNRPSDAGDDDARDIGDWYLTRYCDGVYRALLSTTSDSPRLHSAWMEADTKAGGCGGIDLVVIGWHTTGPAGGASGRGAVVATPGCDEASWQWVDAAGFPVYNGSWLQLDFRGRSLGDPSSFDWRGAVRAIGESGSAIDLVPNGGPEHFVR